MGGGKFGKFGWCSARIGRVEESVAASRECFGSVGGLDIIDGTSGEVSVAHGS